MDIISKRDLPRRADAFGSPPPGPDAEVTWIADRGPDPFRPRSARRYKRELALRGDDWLPLDLGDAPPGEPEAPAQRVVVEGDRRVHVVDAATGRHLHLVGEIRLVGRAWRFVLATPRNGFRASLNSSLATRLAQLDGVPMGGPRTPETLSAEISSLLGYDAHS